jgi:hypothetical protein
MLQNTSQATMNMLFNAERPRFDTQLRRARLRPRRGSARLRPRRGSARLRPQSAPLAPATQQPESWTQVPSFRFPRLPRRMAGREPLGSRSRNSAQAGCRGSGAPPGAQSCVAGAHAASPRDACCRSEQTCPVWYEKPRCKLLDEELLLGISCSDAVENCGPARRR